MTDPTEVDHELMRRVADGDEAAFTELLRKYSQPIHAFVYRMLHDADEADEVTQEVFLRVYRTADLYRPAARFTTWLFAIANNLATDRLRKRQRRPTLSGEQAEGELRKTSDAARNPIEILEIDERAAAVRKAIAELPSDQKTALILFEYEGLSHAEIAEVMGCSKKSVESRLYRAKEILKKKLARWLAL